MKRMVFVAVTMGLAMFGIAGPSMAQRQVATDHAMAGDIARTTKNLLDRRISLSLDKVSLHRAIDAVMAKASVEVSYNLTVLERYPTLVTVHADNEPLGSVLGKVLSGTTLAITGIPGARLAVVEQPSMVQQIINGIVVGKVIHAKTKQPVSGVRLMVDDSIAQSVTPDDGSFRMALPAGTYTIVARAVGFIRRVQQVTVRENETFSLEIVLEPNASVLDEVVVTGTVVATERKAIPTPVTVITAEDIERRGISRIDQLFRGEIPGLLIAEQGSRAFSDSAGAMASVQMYSRGSSTISGAANPIKTYVDGVELLNPEYIGSIDPQSIERIEIITGPQAATIYGSGAMGGVMQIFTKKGTGQTVPDVTLSLRYGVLENSVTPNYTPQHRHTANVTGGSGQAFSYAGSASYDYTGQWQPYLFNRRIGTSVGITHQNGAFRASGSYAITIGKNGTVPGGTNDGNVTPWMRQRIESGHYFFSPVSITRTGFAAFTTQRLATSRNQTASLSLDYNTFSMLQQHLNIGLSSSKFDIIPESPRYRTPLDTLFAHEGSNGSRTTIGYNVTVLPPAVGALSSKMTLGVNGSSGEQVEFSGCSVYKEGESFQECNRNSAYEPLIRLSTRKLVNSSSFGGFGSWQIGLFDQLHFTLGLRGEQNPSYGRAHKIDWTPTYGATYTMELGSFTARMLASYGRATRPPDPTRKRGYKIISLGWTPSEYMYILDAPHLRPERESGPQGGVELYYGNRGAITVNYYRQTVKDLTASIVVDSILRTRDDGSVEPQYVSQWQFVNIGTILKRGWEGTLSANLQNFSLKATYFWSDSRLSRLNRDVYYPGGMLFANGVPTHAGNITLSYAHGGTSVMLINNIMGKSLRGSDASFERMELIDTRNYYMVREVMYITRRRLPDNGEFAGPEYVKSDMMISHRLTPWTSLTVNITNLTDSYQSELSVVYPTLGRQTLLGVSMRFPH